MRAADREQPISVQEVEKAELEALRSQVSELRSQLRQVERNRTSNSPPVRANHEEQTPVNAPWSPSNVLDPHQDDDDATIVESAASILEFLAWGKRKSPVGQSVVSPGASIAYHPEESELVSDVPDGLEHTSNTINILQLLLPNPRQVWQLIDYHETNLLWYHNSYFAPTFRKQLKVFYDHFSGYIIDPGITKGQVDLQWVALFFSILAGSMTCAPPETSRSWGFKASERALLSKRWFSAVISSLNEADYTAKQSILSVQAISTLTISAHLLGNSNTHAVHLAAAVRIAQGLGLHHLTGDGPGNDVHRETGRRVWTHLCSQDWFSTSFYETYLINPLHSSSEPPINALDEELVPLPDKVPTITTYPRFLIKIAAIMPQLLDDLVMCNTAYTKYDQVLQCDKRLRSLVTSECPPCFFNCPIEPQWPIYVPWARRALAISSAHKIIMIHRSFLSESFTNPAFAFTRKTCLAASKTITKEYKAVIHDNGPILWIHQAFSVAAAVILVLDILHRGRMESEFEEHKKLVYDVVDILSTNDSMIASRGTKLLSALLKEVHKREVGTPNPSSSEYSPSKRRRLDNAGRCNSYEAEQSREDSGRGFNVGLFVSTFCNRHNDSGRSVELRSNVTGSSSTIMNDTTGPRATTGAYENEVQGIFYYPSLGLEGTTDFDNLLYLANHNLSFG